MANKDWCAFFPKAAALYLPIQCSDHGPIMVDTHWDVRPKRRPKRFEEVWLRGEGVRQIIDRVWQMQVSGSLGFQLIQKQNILMRHLRNWGDLSYDSVKNKMSSLRGQLVDIQKAMVGKSGYARTSHMTEDERDGLNDMIRIELCGRSWIG